MQKLKMIFATLSIICLNSCKAPDPITVRQYTNYQAEGLCFSREYQYSVEYIGPVGNEQEHPISECNLMIGVKPDDYAKRTIWLNELTTRFKRYKRKFDR